MSALLMGNAQTVLTLIKPLMARAGITRVANITGLDETGIPVVMAVRPNSRSLSVSQGKGVTLEAAKASAIMESLEQYHAEHFEAPLLLGSQAEIAAFHRVADVMQLPRTNSVFCADRRLLWTSAKRLVDGESIIVPLELVHLDMRMPLPEGSGYFALGSNGLASGVALTDAIAHGLCEVIERDALALFYERTPREQSARRIALDTVDDESCRTLLAKFERAGIGVAVWDTTTEIEVAAFLCSVGENMWNPLRPVGAARGYGCHPDRAVALRRALTEAAQSRVTRIAGARDDIQASDLKHIQSKASIDRQLAHYAQRHFATHSFLTVPSQACRTDAEVVTVVRSRLESAGYPDAAYVDLSKSDWPIAVARTIVPGLEGFPDAPNYVAGTRARHMRERRAR